MSIIIRFAIFIVLYSILIYNIDLTQFKDRTDWLVIFSIFASAILVIFQATLCTMRWRLIRSAQIEEVPALFPSLWIYLENMFINQFLPSTVGGDVMRVLRWRNLGVPSVQAASSVMLDRISGLNGAALIVAFAAPFLYFQADQPTLALISVVSGIVVLAATASLFIAAHFRNIIHRVIKNERLLILLEKLGAGLVYDRMFLISVVVSIVPHLVSALSVLVIATAIGVKIDFIALVAISCLTVLATIVPISIAGWGVREMSFVAFLMPFSVSYNDAFLLGFATSLGLLIASLPGGLVTIFPSLAGAKEPVELANGQGKATSANIGLEKVK